MDETRSGWPRRWTRDTWFPARCREVPHTHWTSALPLTTADVSGTKPGRTVALGVTSSFPQIQSSGDTRCHTASENAKLKSPRKQTLKLKLGKVVGVRSKNSSCTIYPRTVRTCNCSWYETATFRRSADHETFVTVHFENCDNFWLLQTLFINFQVNR